MKTLHLKPLILCLIIATFGVVGEAYAGTIFNNFGPANSYDNANFWGVEGSTFILPTGVKQAMPFTPTGNWVWTLTQIDVALQTGGFQGLSIESAVLTLNSDNSGIPGGVLGTWNLSGLPALGSCCAVDTVTASSPIFLSPGTTYWLVAAPVAGNTGDFWAWNNTGSTGTGLQFHDSVWTLDGLSTLSAFDVQGVAPEPGSLLMFSLGVMALGGLRILKIRRE